MQRENEQQQERLNRVYQSRDEIKAQLLISEQIISDMRDHEEDLDMKYRSEVERVIEQLEKKEYTLQVLEERLFDVEELLRELGRGDKKIRERVVALKINPDLHKKKITNVVDENVNLKTQLNEALTQIQHLNKEIEDKNKLLNEKLPPEQRPSRPELGFSMGHRRIESSEIPVFTHVRTQTFQTIDLEKIRSIKDTHPDDYKEKLETNADLLEKKYVALKKNHYRLQRENEHLKDSLSSHTFINEKLKHALEKSQAKYALCQHC